MINIMNWFRPRPKPTPVETTPRVTLEPKIIAPARGLKEEGAFYDSIRKTKLFGPTFSIAEFKGVETVVKACADAKWPISWTAYALATAYHETAGTMQPIKEYGGHAYYMRMYDVSGDKPERAIKHGNITIGDGAKYCGRGYVQLTWFVNYKKAGDKLEVDLIRFPDLALDPGIAAKIMIQGMAEGWFTGVRLGITLPSSKLGTQAQFRASRPIINGKDKADLIADYALDFQEALWYGKWQ